MKEKSISQKAGEEPKGDYVSWYNTAIEPEQIFEVAHEAVIHLSKEIKRTVAKVIVEKDEPIQVILAESS